MKILIIGKNSRITQFLKDYIDKSFQITVKNYIDVIKKNQIFFKKFNFIINCSSNKEYINSIYNSKNDFDLKIVKKIIKSRTSYIFLSTRKIYKPKSNCSEKTNPNPACNYSRNKLITEKKINRLLKNKVLILRISNLIGKPLKKSNRKVSMTFIDNFFKYSKENIILYENHFKDFLSVNQFTRIFYNILKNDLNGTFNVSLGKKVYVSEIIKRLNIKKSLKFKKIKIKKKDSFYLNNKKLNKILKLKLTKKELLNYCHKI